MLIVAGEAGPGGASSADAFDSARPAKTTVVINCSADGPEEIIMFLPKTGWGIKWQVFQDDSSDGNQRRLSS